MTSECRERVAVRAVILINNKVLLGKRGQGIGVGQYALVGGKPVRDESREQTIRRKTAEGVGLQFKNLFFWKDEFDNRTTPIQAWRTYFFIGEAEGKIKLEKDEISEIVLVDRRSFEELDIAFNHREILEEFFGLR